MTTRNRFSPSLPITAALCALWLAGCQPAGGPEEAGAADPAPATAAAAGVATETAGAGAGTATSAAPAAAAAPEGISVTAAWTRATPGTASASVYFTLHNGGPGADELRAITTPIATTAGIHRSELAGGVSRMRPVASLPIAAGETLRAETGALHVMLEGLDHPLVPGDRFPMQFVFRDAAAVNVDVDVRPLTAGFEENATAEHAHQH